MKIKYYKFWCKKHGFFKVKKEETPTEENTELCPICDESMKLMGEFIHIHGKYTSLDATGRKEVLLKRSRDHFKKEVLPNLGDSHARNFHAKRLKG